MQHSHLYKSEKAKAYFIVLLRISLAVVFIWFGLLKVFGYSPVYEIVATGFPILATGPGSIALGALEVLIGVGLLFNFLHFAVHTSLLIHLAGTLAIFFLAPALMFDPFFPVLTLSGEFVLKNIVLVAAGLVTLSYYEGRL